MASDLKRLVQLLCGSFSNQEQAFENPPLYAHINVTVRPLAHMPEGTLLLEQAYAIAPTQPYRIRVLQAKRKGDAIHVLNHALNDEQRFWGATLEPEKLSGLASGDMRLLEGCTYVVNPEEDGFSGEVEPGCRCLVERKGRTSYLVSRFEISSSGMRTIDRGNDPET
ncbi:MAG: chromophore lyase CpcT/CpeT, partial [Synechococcus sp.]|nr:chromophore lyase CpcT/CpeT [Synechococcus sp.]